MLTFNIDPGKVVPSFGADDYCLAAEVNISVAFAGVSAVGHEHGVAIDGGIYTGLDSRLAGRYRDRRSGDGGMKEEGQSQEGWGCSHV
jgi:hypothetical protein